MAGPTLSYDITTVDTAKSVPLGTTFVNNAKEYIYLQGIGSTVVGSVVTFNPTSAGAFVTVLSAANAQGCVAVACGITVASTYGWYQIRGLCPTVKAQTVATGKPCYLAATGTIDDAVVSGDLIAGMFTASTDSGGFCAVYMHFPPVVTDTLS